MRSIYLRGSSIDRYYVVIQRNTHSTLARGYSMVHAASDEIREWKQIPKELEV